MINYTNINEAWGLKDDIDEKKETFKNSQENFEEKNVIKNDDCDLFDQLVKCDKCIEKLESFFNSRNKSNDQELIENMTNKIENLKEEIELLKDENHKINLEHMENLNKPSILENIIENFQVNIKPNRQLLIYICIFTMFIISILLIHSFRKPIEFDTPNKKFFIFPEDIHKLKQLIDIAKN